MNDSREYYVREFIDEYMDRPENKGWSFTYGRALYTWVVEWRFDLDDLQIRDELEEIIMNDSGANREWVSYLSDEAIVEIVDIAILDELWRQIEEDLNSNEDEDDKEYIYWELDKKEFKTREELDEAVKELVSESWNDRLNWTTIAEDYENDNFLDFDED